jgi:hypothetical protein
MKSRKKYVPVFSYTTRYEYLWGSAGVCSLFLNLGIIWKSVVSLTLRLLYLREGVPGTHWMGGRVGPRSVLDTV